MRPSTAKGSAHGLPNLFAGWRGHRPAVQREFFWSILSMAAIIPPRTPNQKIFLFYSKFEDKTENKTGRGLHTHCIRRSYRNRPQLPRPGWLPPARGACHWGPQHCRADCAVAQATDKHTYQHKPRCSGATEANIMELNRRATAAAPHHREHHAIDQTRRRPEPCFGLCCHSGRADHHAHQHLDGQNSHQGVAIDTFAKEVEKRTGGRYKVQTFYNGALGGERESIEAVQLGTQSWPSAPAAPSPTLCPRPKSSTCPFLFRDKAHARAVLDGPIGKSCWPSLTPRASRPWPGQKTASVTHDEQQAFGERP